MIGGMITAPLLSLFVIPVIYLMWKGRGLGAVDVQSEPADDPLDEQPAIPETSN
jgi:Cu(I)/Ag(I) efflux system membrane protein CusA/SilA